MELILIWYRSTKQNWSPRAWSNKPVFDLGCRNHTVFWGMFALFFSGQSHYGLKVSSAPRVEEYMTGLSTLKDPYWNYQGALEIVSFLLPCFDFSSAFHHLLWQFETKSHPDPWAFYQSPSCFCPVLPFLLLLFFSFDLKLQKSSTSSLILKYNRLDKSLCAHMPEEMNICSCAIILLLKLRNNTNIMGNCSNSEELGLLATCCTAYPWISYLSSAVEVQRNVSQEKQQSQIWLSAICY